jgi:hypothetical protein
VPTQPGQAGTFKWRPREQSGTSRRSTGFRLTPVDFDPFSDVRDRTASFALSEAQREIWAAVQMGPEASCAFNLCFALQIVGAVSVDDLRSSLRHLFDRHEALRLTFDASGEWQRVQPLSTLDVPVVEPVWLRACRPHDSTRRDLHRGSETFDLVSGPPARVRIVVEARNQCLLVFTAHHIAFDGWSSGIFFSELADVYVAARQRKLRLSRPSRSAALARDTRGDGVGGSKGILADAVWWLRAGAGSTLRSTTSRPQELQGAKDSLTLGAELSKGIRNAAAREGTTTTGFLLAAFHALLHRLTGQTDIVVGLPISVRNVTERETLVGHATNFLPIRVSIESSASLATHCAR